MNSIVHFEIPAKDKDAFRKFYTETFGWKFNEMPEMNYTIVYTSDVDDKYMPTTPGAVNGGMMSEEENGGKNPVLVIDVPSIDEYITKIEAAGGKITQPKTTVGEMGWYARFTDPNGVVMGIWETIKR